ncbi:response regulator [Sphingomicrobium aestuariivivum]|uniref:response regulator n=1 Tax=Sphingomicrobium aestuariivivum TaxID=1582356 RepID=UPI001FD65CB3|nr:response regulator [Sphingomicrobium aestuariivivum]MCJ8191986.1 response regulator [Sphingomicrobium aestuariivivum]
MARRPRLLLIDDEPKLAAFLAEAARLSAFDPVVATDHHDFREIFLNDAPDMIAVDLGMPGMDGIELLRFLADHDANQPVLIVSGFEERVIETAFRLGRELGLTMVGPIGKPARLDTLESLFGEVRQRLVA